MDGEICGVLAAGRYICGVLERAASHVEFRVEYGHVPWEGGEVEFNNGSTPNLLCWDGESGIFIAGGALLNHAIAFWFG